MFNTDCHFAIGKTHLNGGKPCQDYALSGIISNNACYAIVSDGCSTGGNTDVGARVVGLCTARTLNGLSLTANDDGRPFPPRINELQKMGIDEASKLLGLAHKDMLATCVYCYVSENEGFFGIQGDGVVAYKLRGTNIIHMNRYEWNRNTPFYPAYMTRDLNSFINAHGGDLDATTLTCEYWEYDPGIGFNVVEENIPITLAKGIEGVTVPIPQLSHVEFAAVFSDGVTQVDGVDWKQAVIDLLAFKTTEGDFAKRRMNRFLKEAEKSGKGPMDDIGYAVIHLLNTQVI